MMHDRAGKYPAQLNVMILGASGVFGARLARLACKQEGIKITLAARNLDRLRSLARELPGEPNCVSLDRETLTARDLIDFDVIVDASGPFHASNTRVVESAIAANCDYVDLADGREFVASFSRFDEIAKGAEVALTTGAS